jgi:hypothetical protein
MAQTCPPGKMAWILISMNNLALTSKWNNRTWNKQLEKLLSTPRSSDIDQKVGLHQASVKVFPCVCAGVCVFGCVC